MKLVLVALVFGLTGSAYATETWHVTAGSEHWTWPLTRSSTNGVQGLMKVTNPDGSRISATILGSSKQVLSTELTISAGEDQTYRTCFYRIAQQSPTAVSGIRRCTGKTEEVPWSATIEGDAK